MKKRYKFWAGILISGLFFLLFVRGMDLKKVWTATRQANYFFILLAIVVNVGTFLIRAERWEYLLEPIKKVRFPSLFSAVCIGFMGNSLLPARAGEFIRAYVIGKREGITKTGAFATIVTERLFDGLTLLLMLIIVVAVFPFPEKNYGSYITIGFLKWAVGVTSFFYGIVIATLFFLSWKPDHVWRLMSLTLFRYLPAEMIKRIEVLYRAFLSGLESLKRGRHILSIGIYSILLWMLTAFGIYLLFPAFSIRLDFLSAILIMVVVAVVVMLPSSPGFVGTFHLASSEALILLGINAHVAKTFAIVHHAACIIPVVTLGLFYLSREQLSFREIKASVPEEYKVLEKGDMPAEGPLPKQS
ncbi:MAG: lysylphosphatidylglycerol synthase transmembrane domain-containing protein [bacterium]